MSRRPARRLFGVAAAAAAGVLLVTVVLALGPTEGPGAASDGIALVRLEELREDQPVRIAVRELSGLDRLANAQRERREMSLWGPRSRPQGMPIFVVRSDELRAFLGVDPRTGCDLEYRPPGRDGGGVLPSALHDVCHGSLYDLTGRRLGGPTAWQLDQLVLRVRGGVVYADARSVVPGAWALPGY